MQTFEEFKKGNLGKILPDCIMQSTKSEMPIVVLVKDAVLYKEKKACTVFIQLKKPYKAVVMDNDTFQGTIKVNGKDVPRFIEAPNNEEVLKALYDFWDEAIVKLGINH